MKNSTKVILAVAVSAANLASMQSVNAQQTKGFMLEEIVVTARKRDEGVMDVPLAISAMSSDFIEKANISTMEDVAANTVGLTFQSFNGGGLSSPVIRGLAQTDISSSDNNVGVFLDGAFINGKSNIDIGLLDVERIEVVKGPQSAMFGRNSFAGAINYVLKRPGDELEGKVVTTVGSDGLAEMKASVRGPLIDGILSGGLSVSTSEFDGTLKNGFGGENLGGWDSKKSASGSLYYTPTDRLSADLFYYYGESRLDPTAGYIMENNCGASVQTLFPRRGGDGGTYYCGEAKFQDEYYVSSFAEDSVYRTEKSTLKVTYDFDDMSLTFMTSFGDYSFDGLSDQIYSDTNDNNTTRRFSVPFVGPASDKSFELRLQSTDVSPFQWMAGIYTFHGEASQFSQTFSATTPLASSQGNVIRDKEDISDVQAVFASMDYEFTDWLSASVEMRYTEEEKTQKDYLNSAEDDENYQFFTPRASLTWMLNEDANVYVSYAEGVKSGGFNATTYEPEVNYDEEHIKMYELGYKSRLFDGAMNLSSAVFFFNWDDIQFTAPTHDPAGTTNTTQNIGEADGWGAEVELNGMITDNFQYRFGVAWTNPEFVDGTQDTGSERNCPDTTLSVTGCSTDIGGNPVPRMSEWQFNLGGTYWFDVMGESFYLRADASYESKKYARPLAVLEYGEYTLINLRAAWTRENLEVALWGKNVLNEEYIRSTVNEPEFGGFVNTGTTATSSSFTTGLPANTATYGLTATYNF